MKGMKSLLMVLALGIGMHLSATAMAQDTVVSAKLSTLGYGVEVTKPMSKKTNVRFGLNGANFDDTRTESGIDYDFDLKLRSGTVLFDWRPSGGGFHTTLGAVLNGNELNATAKTSGSITIGDTTYAAGTSLTAEVTFNDVAPYLGVGWGNPFGSEKQFSLAFDLGVVFQGSPKVKLSAGAGVSQSDIDKEQQQLEDELKDFKYYPVIAFNFGYKF